MITIPILLYHSVSADPAGWIAPYSVSPQTFSEHVEFIAASGRTPMTVSGLVAALRGERTLPPNPLLLTFDDGFADFADAAEVLARHNLPSTLYVTTGALAGRGSTVDLCLPPAPMLSWPQLAELAERNVEIGAHTHTHPQLDTLRRARLADEIRRCKGMLEDALSTDVRSFAYPHGFHSTRVRAEVEAAGYTSACAVMNASSSTDDHPFALARFTVGPTTGTERLAAWLAGCDVPVAPYPERLRTKAWRTYRRIRGNNSAHGVIAVSAGDRKSIDC